MRIEEKNLDADDEPRFSRSQKFAREEELLTKNLRIREVAAAERAARWAVVATIIALISLAVSLWPILHKWLT
jgi:hypothetical protein